MLKATRTGEPQGGGCEGEGSCRAAGRNEAHQCCGARRGEGDRDTDLLRLPIDTLAPDPHEQSIEANHSRNPPTHTRGRRRIPGWDIDTDAGRGDTHT